MVISFCYGILESDFKSDSFVIYRVSNKINLQPTHKNQKQNFELKEEQSKYVFIILISAMHQLLKEDFISPENDNAL